MLSWNSIYFLLLFVCFFLSLGGERAHAHKRTLKCEYSTFHMENVFFFPLDFSSFFIFFFRFHWFFLSLSFYSIPIVELLSSRLFPCLLSRFIYQFVFWLLLLLLLLLLVTIFNILLFWICSSHLSATIWKLHSPHGIIDEN